MNQALDVHKIRSFLGDEIYHQAIDLLQMGNLKQINFNDTAVHVEVQGSDIYPHVVEIELENERLSTISCSCNGNAVCVHMGVAVIHYSRIKKKTSDKISKSIPEKKISEKQKSVREFMPCSPEHFIELYPFKEKLYLRLFFKYKSSKVYYTEKNEIIYLKPEDIRESFKNAIRRDFSVERKTADFVTHLFSLHEKSNREGKGSSGTMNKSADYILPLSVPQFIDAFGEKLSDKNIQVRLKGRSAPVNVGKGKIFYSTTLEGDWFSITALCRDSQGREHKINVDKHIANGVVKAGDSYAVVNRKERKSIQRLMNLGMDKEGSITAHKLNLPVMEEIFKYHTGCESDSLAVGSIIDFIKRREKLPQYNIPSGFTAELRDYQYAGFCWLNYLYEHGINGCLADDMGLGKTVQTLAFMQGIKERDKRGLSLLVLPVITMANWEHEIKRFAPGLTACRHEGSSRAKEKNSLLQYDLVLVSYHTLRNDIELFSDINFNYVILDEAQTIKNSSSLIYKSVRMLKSTNRLSLTGTPLENNTGELWAQMEFLNPGLLGSRNHFNENYAKPIEAEGSEAAAGRLKSMISPFLLRRRKDEVLDDLPPKEEIILYSEMGVEQREVYETYRNGIRTKIDNALKEKGKSGAGTEIFEGLLRLRQISLFPSIVDEKYNDVESCKFRLFQDMLKEVRAEGHKTLVFSQFKTSLKIIRKYLDDENIMYSYIDGSIRDRDSEIKRFQEDKKTEVFLLSLKAGGVGINLTAADYVFLLDPWWNPAVEQQAIDRSHRIGRTGKVTAYKCIVKGTVEEKILKLQEKKRDLAEGLITSTTGNLKHMSEEEIISLFE